MLWLHRTLQKKERSGEHTMAAETSEATGARNFFQVWLLLQLKHPHQDLLLPPRWQARALQVSLHCDAALQAAAG